MAGAASGQAALICAGELQLQETVNAAQGLLETLHGATSDAKFWRVPAAAPDAQPGPAGPDAPRNPHTGAGLASDPLSHTIEDSYARYRDASIALRDTLSRLQELQEGMEQGREKERGGELGTEGGGRGPQELSEMQDGSAAEADDSHVETEAGAGAMDVDPQGASEAAEGEADEARTQRREGEALDLAALQLRRDQLRKRVASKNKCLERVAARLQGIVDAAVLWQSAALVKPRSLHGKD